MGPAYLLGLVQAFEVVVGLQAAFRRDISLSVALYNSALVLCHRAKTSAYLLELLPVGKASWSAWMKTSKVIPAQSMRKPTSTPAKSRLAKQSETQYRKE
jgi:hypothetical protein